MKQAMRNYHRIKAFGKIQNLFALAAPRLLMLQVPMNTSGPCPCLVQLTDGILTTWKTTTENAIFSIYFPGNLQIFVKSYIHRIVSNVQQCQRI